jgi:ankyrin repeat protein
LRLPAAVALGRADDVDRLVREEPGCLGPGGRWRTLIVRAAEGGSSAVIETLVRLGASVDAIDDPETAVDETGGYTALHAAAWRGNLSAIDTLLRLGASVRIRDHKYGATAAGWADYAGRAAARDRLVQADIDIFDAMRFGLADRVHALLDADPDLLERPFGEHPSTDLGWCTPLAAAALSDNPAMVRVLLDRGARQIASPDGKSLLELVQERGLARPLELLS